MMKKASAFMAASLLFVVGGCVKELPASTPEPALEVLEQKSTQIGVDNNQYRLELLQAEYITMDGSGQVGQTVYFKNTGNKQLSQDFVPADFRRGGRTNITYAIDKEVTADNGISQSAVQDAIARAMTTWDNASCSELNITRVPYSGNLGIMARVSGFGSVDDNIIADVQHSGFLPGAFFNTVAQGGSSFILGVTFTFIYVSLPSGNPTDIDGNGKADVGMREIYYNDAFNWTTNGFFGADIETIALHESGHALSQAHFGKATVTESNGRLHLSPRAVMNAGYIGVQRQLAGTDIGGHCSIWETWPTE